LLGLLLGPRYIPCGALLRVNRRTLPLPGAPARFQVRLGEQFWRKFGTKRRKLFF